jgi:hypothetical protein
VHPLATFCRQASQTSSQSVAEPFETLVVPRFIAAPSRAFDPGLDPVATFDLGPVFPNFY